MGGIKNRDEKRKKNNVFSSGGGGGTKGPAAIDKRNQEDKCPYCDRSFKQSGRLKEHIANKHKEQAEASSSDAAGPADAPAAAASSSEAPSTSKPADKAAKVAGGSAARPASGASGSGATAPSAAGSMMDVGSAAGYYTSRSPKLLLLEWCGKDRRPRPRYKPKQLDDGRFECKVVLPDAKKADDDVVVFLPPDLAADTADEAEQRVAVAALHRVAGNRKYDMLLPAQYVPQWNLLVDRSEEVTQRRAAAERAAAVRKKRQLQAEEPLTVAMSEAFQRKLTAILDASKAAAGGLPGGSDEPEKVQAAVEALVGMGFSEQQAAAAVAAVGVGEGGGATAALDWLLLRVANEDLPANFQSGSKTNAVSVMRVSGPAPERIARFGYPIEEAAEQLQETGGDELAALARLYQRLTGLDVLIPSQEALAMAEADGGAEHWADERVVLDAMYLPGEVIFPSASSVELLLTLPDDLGLQADANCRLILTITSIPDTALYPHHPPLVALRCPAVPPRALRHLTKTLAEASQAMAGMPMVHELAGRALEALPDALSARGELPGSLAAAEAAAEEAPAARPAGSRGSTGRMPQRQRRRVDVAAENERLARQQREVDEGGALEAIRRVRRSLPAFTQREAVVEAVARHRVTVISGATGCGKSTQVPQYLLEDAIARGCGGACNVVVTQPRRIAAVGLAQRVSNERGEDGPGGTVGYSVRLENRTSPRTRLLFCTTGILLRRLLGDAELQDITHVVVDEVHERSIDIDLLLLLLRDLCAGPRGHTLRVVLMSATADADLFARYMGACLGPSEVTVLTIPGFTYPVRELYLEDVLEATRHVIGVGSKYAKKRQFKEEALAVAAESRGASGGDYSTQTLRSLAVVDEAVINYELLEDLVCYITEKEGRLGAGVLLEGLPMSDEERRKVREVGGGAILVFMPGAPEIGRAVRALGGSDKLARAAGGRERVRVLPLHGGLSSGEQSKVFVRPPPGVRKIVVATNVAETSITIDDVTTVIDTGRLKETSLDPDRGITRLTETWVSQAAAQQRRGRAGRVRPGACFRLYSRSQWDRLNRQQAPEIQRTPLAPLCLTIKGLLPAARAADVLLRTVSPPAETAVEAALQLLHAISALDADEALTPLGQHLKEMPLDPHVGKMLVYAAMLGCLDPALTLAAAMGHGRPLFMSPAPDRREETAAARAALLERPTAAHSDHLAVVTAFNNWSAARRKGGRQAAGDLCRQLHLSEQGMEAVDGGRGELASTLAELGFLSQQEANDIRWGRDDAYGPGASAVNAMASNAKVFKAAITAGFYPNMLRVRHPRAKFVEVEGGAFQDDNDPSGVKLFDAQGRRVWLHPGSVNFAAGRFESGWLVWTELALTSKPYVRECSMAPIYSILLFGGEIQVVGEDRKLLTVDEWMEFKAGPKIALLVREIRSELSRLLSVKIADPSFDLAGSKAVGAVVQLLATDGF